MSTRRFPFPPALAPCLALALITMGTPSVGHAAPEGDFEQMIAQADAHVGEGRNDEALRAYAEAFRAMPAELQASGVGEFVAVAAGKAALDDFAARSDRRSLERARDILRAFVAAVKRADPATDPAPIEAAVQRLAEIDALLAETETETETETAATAAIPPPAGDEDDQPAKPAAEPDAPPDRSRLGLALAVSGGVVAMAGLGLVIAGARQVPWYEQKLEAEGWQPTDEGYDEQIADAERTRNLDIGLGVGALAVGVGLGVTGAVVMARSKKGKKGSVALGPMLDRDRAGVLAVVRF